MAFSNQFVLSLEVTRLVPLATFADKAAQALVRYAREPRHSGSDIVVEEDLIAAFGRCRVSLVLGSSFGTVVTKSASNTSLWEGILLQSGPGPTLTRALRETLTSQWQFSCRFWFGAASLTI